jgi:hypothetical protein
MIKHGTKYIFESEDPEWFEELNLDRVTDPKTGRLLISPPIGTEVTIKFIVDVPCRINDDTDEVIVNGEVMKYHDDDPNILLIMFDGGWQQPCGWECSEEKNLWLEDSHIFWSSRCYWIHVEEEEVYLKGSKLQESFLHGDKKDKKSPEDDDLEWAKNVVSNKDIDLNDAAWFIELDGSKKQFIESQKWAFNRGFSWTDSKNRKRSYGKEIITSSMWDDPVYSLGSLFSDNYLTYSTSKPDREDSISTAQRHSRKNKVYIFKWKNNDAVLEDIVELKKINESEEDGLEWAQEVIKQDPTPTMIKLGDGKRFMIPENSTYNERWHTFVGWNDWKEVTGVSSLKEEECYIITDGTYGDIYIPKSQIKDNEKSYLKKITESEDLEWAQDTVMGYPRMKFVDASKIMDTDDIIEVTGELTDDSGVALCNLDGHKFRVNRRVKGGFQVIWLTPRIERPVGWVDVTNETRNESEDNLVLYDDDGGFNDNDLDITFIEKSNHPF